MCLGTGRFCVCGVFNPHVLGGYSSPTPLVIFDISQIALATGVLASRVSGVGLRRILLLAVGGCGGISVSLCGGCSSEVSVQSVAAECRPTAQGCC